MGRLILIGQRGVGKSSLLRRLQSYQSAPDFFCDLDEEIEKHSGRPISDIFAADGEAEFRRLELKTFHALLASHSDFVCAVGAGFPVAMIPADCHCLWLKRRSDELGRIFLDRPRLLADGDALSEFRQFAKSRGREFSERADEIYFLPEGLHSANATEAMVLASSISDFADGILTISPWHLKRRRYLHKIARSRFELRTDWLTTADMESLHNFKDTKVIVSFRNKGRAAEGLEVRASFTDCEFDWPIELGSCPASEVDIISAHEGKNLSDLLLKLERQGGERHLKAAPKIDNFSELKQLIEWQRENPKGRSVLPRSEEGRWAWVRLMLKGRQKITFWRDNAGSASDQPTLYQWLSCPESPRQFAAVLGDPTAFSRTPIEHQAYFAKIKWPVFDIQIHKEEMAEALPFMQEMGLRAAAVTSPHKQMAFLMATDQDAITTKLQSANTLWISTAARIFATNTDWAGLEPIANEIPPQSEVVIWGGGGTLAPLKMRFPRASAYSVRSGEPRPGERTILSPTVLIWAAGPQAQRPTNMKSIRLIVDLNYREDSLARAFALDLGAKYVSGESMFFRQAEAQRSFFNNLLDTP